MFGRATITLGIDPHSSYHNAMRESLACAESLRLRFAVMPRVARVCQRQLILVMAALCYRAGHYIFALWFLSFFLSFFLA